MVLELSSLTNFTEKRDDFINLLKTEPDVEKQGDAYKDMINALADDVLKEANKETKGLLEQARNAERNGLDQEQYEFFNEINTDVGYKDEKLLPQTTINQIFDELKKERPLLDKLGIFNAGPRMKFLKSETEGVAVWGKIFGEIKGQLDAKFSEEEAIQDKLTAFIVVPKDLEDLDVKWIEQFVRIQIVEAFSAALEAAFLNGDGNDKPVGLQRAVYEDVPVSGGVYPEKEPTGTLNIDADNLVQEFKKVMKHHSVKENGEGLVISGKVVMVVSPGNIWDFEAKFTDLTDDRQYVKAVPYKIDLVESEFQAPGEATTFVRGRYDAVLGGGVNIKKYEETLAIEDMDLYTSKQFAYGKAKDDKAAAVWTLAGADIDEETVPAG